MECVKVHADELVKDDSALLVSYDGVYDSTISNVNIIKLINKHLSDKDVNPHKLDWSLKIF